MKRKLQRMLLPAAILASVTGAFAGTATPENPALNGTSDNFNSRNGIGLSGVKGFLQGNCWFFSDFDINRNGWSPNLEGDGAMVSGTGADATEMTGIYTPLLDINGAVNLSFKYKFNQSVRDRRWIKIWAADASNKPAFLLDSLELTGSNATTVYHYRKSLTPRTTGLYKLYINYQGINGSARIAIDQLSIGATTHYASTCNTAPVALADKFEGTEQHTAEGDVLNNDYDPNHETLTAYLLNDSPDGAVNLKTDGTFVFTPRPEFNGSTTHFSYKICDNGYPSLCSLTATATLHFPVKPVLDGPAALSAGLSGLNAMYSRNTVDINWNIAAGNRSARFQIERSIDGEHFQKVGEVLAGTGSTNITAGSTSAASIAADASPAAPAQSYLFTDKVRQGITRKNDLYYRLLLIDANNRSAYSKVLIVRAYDSKSVEAVSVTPDPTVNDIQINVQLKESSFVVMKVTDARGEEIMKKTARGGSGANNYSLDGTSRLQPGMYQLEVIINSNERLTMKLAKS